MYVTVSMSKFLCICLSVYLTVKVSKYLSVSVTLFPQSPDLTQGLNKDHKVFTAMLNCKVTEIYSVMDRKTEGSCHHLKPDNTR